MFPASQTHHLQCVRHHVLQGKHLNPVLQHIERIEFILRAQKINHIFKQKVVTYVHVQEMRCREGGIFCLSLRTVVMDILLLFNLMTIF